MAREMFASLKKKKRKWGLVSTPKSWEGRKPIYQAVEEFLANPQGDDTLPDEQKVSGHGIRWISGGSDGAFGHHGGIEETTDRALPIYLALKEVLDEATETKLDAFYALLLEVSALDIADPLIELIFDKKEVKPERLLSVAEFIAVNAPDREPVKTAVAILGSVRTDAFKIIFLTLGKHEEFTLFAAVALKNSLEDPEAELFELGKHVKNWGRIQVVERLADTKNPIIKFWMLREGYKNGVMNEYLAYTCAVSGELAKALEPEQIDRALLLGAGELISALIAGGPAERMDDYEDGALATERYLHHLQSGLSELEQLLVIDHIRGFLNEEADWDERTTQGWTPQRRAALLQTCQTLIALPQWKVVVSRDLDSSDPTVYFRAEAAARVLGLDSWEKTFARLQAGADSGWHWLMESKDPARLEKTLALAESLIPLNTIATGAADELGLGVQWKAHQSLDLIVQELGAFPGQGWNLVLASLKSPVVRNRNMALRTLSQWGKAGWPPATELELHRAMKAEPNEDLRTRISAVLNGEKLS